MTVALDSGGQCGPARWCCWCGQWVCWYPIRRTDSRDRQRWCGLARWSCARAGQGSRIGGSGMVCRDGRRRAVAGPQLLALALLMAVRQTTGRSKGQPMVSNAAETPDKRSCADIVGAAAAECPRSVAQSISVAELQRVCDLKMVALTTDQLVKQVRSLQLWFSAPVFWLVGFPNPDHITHSLSNWQMAVQYSWLMTRAGRATRASTTLTRASGAHRLNARAKRAQASRVCGGCQ